MNTFIINGKFLKCVEDYVQYNDKNDLKYIIKNKTKIPPIFKKKKTYYRGMLLNTSDVKKVMSSKFKLKDVSSWAKDEATAKKFATDNKYITKNNKNSIPIIIKKTFTPILDIESYVMYMMGMGLLGDFDDLALDSVMKEKEVIAPPMSIKSSDIIFL